MSNEAFKTPAEIKDYTIEWDADDGCGSPVLEPGERVASSTWSASNVHGDTSLNVAADPSTISSDGLSTTVWLGGGLAGEIYSVTNTVITNNSPPRTYSRTYPCYVNAVNSL